ncbi:ABC transporter substrate-binding protein [Kitasatospora acidiphila]|uniref:ABC transporter substrate-binding protein n=1 Tax=Kitasatospora acidiphila TaxID=2567942 RepID=A0A540WAY7_9ACTN|nr:ABC transporter substrate-binding protein [Kitasatospora acidiphila]TQF06077.1 ABC transporter substrate-binding protein [Kitasatospora acidiphila]
MTPLSSNDLTEPEPWDPPKPWWRRRTGGTAMAAALVMLGTGLYVGLRPASTSCGEGLAKRGANHECVGLTDGSRHFSFTPDLTKVSGLIAAENQGVTSGSTPWVGVVYLLPAVPSADGTSTADSIRHELEGAYIAQYLANHRNTNGDAPKIRLLLANPGHDEGQRDYTLGQIEAHRAQDHIVAVAGLGTSTTGTKGTIDRITQDGLAAFGSVITADELTPTHGLVRVAPPNSDEAAAAGAFLQSYLKDKPNAKVQLVRDAVKGDLYSSSLADQFKKNYHAQLLPHDMVFDSGEQGVSTNFANQMAGLCQNRPAAVFFAGRGIDLPQFLAPLSQRQCVDQQLIVIAGDDASQVTQSAGREEVKKALSVGNIRLLYTGLAHPDAWKLAPQVYSAAAIEPFTAGGEFTRQFSNEELFDGQAIMGHDALLAAVVAIRAAVSASTPPDQVTGSTVIQMLTALYGPTAIEGASGLISLDNNGNPVNKAIPIVEFKPNGQVVALDVSSSTGQPPQAQ